MLSGIKFACTCFAPHANRTLAGTSFDVVSLQAERLIRGEQGMLRGELSNLDVALDDYPEPPPKKEPVPEEEKPMTYAERFAR